LNMTLPKKEICSSLKWLTQYITYYEVTMTQVFHKIVYSTNIFENSDVDLINKLPKWL